MENNRPFEKITRVKKNYKKHHDTIEKFTCQNQWFTATWKYHVGVGGPPALNDSSEKVWHV